MGMTFREYDRCYLEKIVQECTSLRGMGKIIGISGANVKSVLSRYGIDYSHFSHGKTYDKMIGKKYHMLKVLSIRVVIKEENKDERKRKYAVCLCDCGNKKDVRAEALKAGRYISCGCHSKDRWNMVGGKNPYFKGVGELRQTKYSEIKRSAKQRDKEFDVSIEYLWELYEKQNRKCALTNLPIVFGRNGHRNETSASLDRIDNNKGYLEGNVRWVLKDINMIRGSYDTDYFIKLCHAVAGTNPMNKIPEN